MKGERQLRFLDHRLRVSDAKWRIVLCHAPLLAHNPQGGRQEVPYLNVDHQLQKILDGRKTYDLSERAYASFSQFGTGMRRIPAGWKENLPERGECLPDRAACGDIHESAGVGEREFTGSWH